MKKNIKPYMISVTLLTAIIITTAVSALDNSSLQGDFWILLILKLCFAIIIALGLAYFTIFIYGDDKEKMF